MKLLAVTQEHAKRPVVRITYGHEAIFFTGEQPRVPQMLALELPGLEVATQTGVRHWLVRYHREHPELAAPATTKKRKDDDSEHATLVQPLWRQAVLDDFIDSHNGHELIWHVAYHFTLAQIAEFTEKHGPTLLAETKAAIATERARRASVLRTLEKRTSRIVPVFYSGMSRVPIEATEIEMEADRAKVADLRKAPFDAAAWIDACAMLKHDVIKRELLGAIGENLVRTGSDISAALDRMCKRGLDQVWSNELWLAIKDHLVLDQNLTGEAIDLTRANEVTVVATWDIWKAKRVGPIKIGRSALAVSYGKDTVYVRGERKLLHRIRSRGGTLARWGNTLVVGGKQRDAGSAHEKLLEVDRIDTLAQVDPAAAAKLAGDLAPTDPITTALDHARTEPTWRRILADLLIERLVGIDADVARRLARAQGRRNRR